MLMFTSWQNCWKPALLIVKWNTILRKTVNKNPEKKKKHITATGIGWQFTSVIRIKLDGIDVTLFYLNLYMTYIWYKANKIEIVFVKDILCVEHWLTVYLSSGKYPFHFCLLLYGSFDGEMKVIITDFMHILGLRS